MNEPGRDDAPHDAIPIEPQTQRLINQGFLSVCEKMLNALELLGSRIDAIEARLKPVDFKPQSKFSIPPDPSDGFMGFSQEKRGK